MRGVLLAAALFLGSAGSAAAAVAPVRIASDPFAAPVIGQHATIAEPDSFSFGQTVVAAFQVGRLQSGGAAAIGWATSTDGGTTWRNGILPALSMASSPPGPYTRVSDPVVAYDRLHGTWLVSVLALSDRPGTTSTSAVVTSRSPDGLAWSAPVVTAPDRGFFTHDKNWIVCDNWTASPFAGRCYTVWTNVTGSGALAMSVSSDGGLTWSAERAAAGLPSGNGVLPLVLPNGVLVVPYRAFAGEIVAARSVDGGVSFAPAVARVGSGAAGRVQGLRSPPLPSGEVDGGGRLHLAWHTCAFRAPCVDESPGAVNDLALASTTNGVDWTSPRRIPLAGGGRVLPGLGVDTSTRGAGARLALVHYTLSPAGCDVVTCRLRAVYASSSDGGVRWSAPLELSPQPMELSWLPQTSLGRMVGDYFSTSFVGGGVAVPVFTAALPPAGGAFRQDLYAAPVPPLAAAPVRLVAQGLAHPRRVRAGTTLRVTLRVARADGPSSLAGARVSCGARLAGRALPVAARRVLAAGAECAWRLPRGRTGPIAGTISLRLGEASVSRRFTSRAA